MQRIELDESDRQQLIADIATRAGTARELAKWWDTTPAVLRQFVADYREEIETYAAAENEPEEPEGLTPIELSDLWITNKFERLKRLQDVAERAYDDMTSGRVLADATALREFRSYLALAANELGQLLHRGSGDAADGETLEVIMHGIDMDKLK